MIIVKPNGGLGNRMRVINSAICLAEKNDHPAVKVLWKKDPGMNASIADIFKPINDISTIENKLLMTCYFYAPKLIGSYQYYDDDSVIAKQFNDEYWNRNHYNVVLNTCFDFYELNSQTNFYHIFQPAENLQQRINEVCATWQDDVIGVHIRRTDNVPASCNSKTSDFIGRMEQELVINSNIKFYLSTDDPETEKSLQLRFGDRVRMMGNKNLNRNIKSGIEDAVIDMYCLSRTNLILGSYSSSFSAVASAIGKIPLEIVTKK